MPFSIVGKAPGVYIDEVQIPGPIPGVGTSIAAFVGPTIEGVKAKANEPIAITSWTQFCSEVGAGNPPTPYATGGTPNVTHAVRGFFENGGSSCYFVRIAKDPAKAASPSDYKAAIDALKRIDEVTLVCVPDSTDLEVQKHLILHCESMGDRFAILDSAWDGTKQGKDNLEAAKTQRGAISSESGYAALYYPWITIGNPLWKTGDAEDSRTLAVPPSGHIAGMYARSDATRGVHKAPANEQLRGVLSLRHVLTDDEQGPLNDLGINSLRWFTGRGAVVWGARTLTPKEKTQWRYVNVRRLLNFIEESLQEGTQFAVFEPNGLPLWQTVKRQATEFLTRVWRDGALFGATPDQAFRVRVDEELNPPAQRALGQLVIEVVVYPVTPAEFVVFRIIQKPGGPDVQEK